MHRATFASILLLGALCGTSSAALHAQNPLTRPARVEHPFAGSFAGKDIALELRVDGQAHEYQGWLTFQGQRYAATGDVKGDQLQGNFLVDGQSFIFTARLDGDRLSLSSGGTDYDLARQSTNPLRRGNTPAPLPVPGSTPRVENPPAATVGGVGIGFAPNEDGELVVKAIMPGGPASKTGLKPGGILVAIDGKDVDGMSPEQIRALMQGPVGSLVTLTIDTPDELLDVVIQRGALPADAPPPPAGGRSEPLPGADRGGAPFPGTDAPRPDAPAAAALPEWLRDGARVTFWSGSASLAGVRSHLVQDDQGNWVDAATGQRFSDQSTMNTGGMGYQQLNIVHAGADGIAVDSRTYIVPDPQTQVATLAISTGYLGSADAIGDYWVHPAKLQALQDGNQGGTRIVRGPYTLEGRQYNAVSIRSDSASGFSQHTYDLATGLCLANSTSSTGAAVAVTNPNGTASTGAGTTTITHTRLLSVRQLQLPWADDGLPPGVQAGQSLDYRGTYTTEIPGSPVMPWQFTATFQFDRVADGFATGKLRTHLDSGMGMPQDGTQDRVFGACMIGGLFVGPRTLQQLRPQQVLDEDPITRVRTVVEGAQNGVLTIVEQSPAQEARYGYDLRTGMLVASSQREQNGVATTVLQVQLAGRR